jgi:hypothetical protein
LGRKVRYRRAIYERHLADHPETVDYLQEAVLTISDPDSEYQEEEDTDDFSCRVYYRMGMGRDEFERCLLKIPVYYDGTDEGEVATFHFTRRVARGTLLWRRDQD